jgi:CP family cyanate transporter-like MFS transporter
VTGAIAVIPRGGRVVAVLGIVLVALSMRNAVAVVSPVFGAISDDLGFDPVVLSFIGAAPPLGFALAGLVVPRLTRRWGLEATLLAALGAILIGEGVRALAGEEIVLVSATMLTMLGIGGANVLLPPLVRRYFPERIGLFTSLYLVLMGVGASVPAFSAVHLTEVAGWRVAIGVWVVIPLLALGPWLSMLRTPRPPRVEERRPEGDASRNLSAANPGFETRAADAARSSTREAGASRRHVAASPTVWAITAALGLSSISIYVAMGYLPAMLTSAGVDAATAGASLGIAVALGIPEALLVPLLASRRAAVLPMIVTAGLCAVGGWGGLLFAPAAAPLLWGLLVGLVPITFPLSLLLVNTRTRSHRVTVSVSAFVQGVAYIVAGTLAFAVGLLHDATGSWTAPMWLALATALLAVPAIVILGRDRMVDDELAG